MQNISSVNNTKKIAFYLVVVGAFALFIYLILKQGTTNLEVSRQIVTSSKDSNYWHDFITGLQHSFRHPLAILLGQIVAIIITARFFGYLAKKVRQPAVVGEVIAGIVLGPSLLGLYFPDFATTLFPAQSLGNLQLLSQIGLILFMFVIGMELDLTVLRNRAHDAVVVSHASIIVPFALGVTFAYFTYETFAPQTINFTSFALFMGIAMSITAFPVLARIVQERGIQKTKLGTIVITCAAADDITAWCILAAVIAIVKAGSFGSSLFIILMAIGYVFVMLKVVKPFLKRIGDLHTSRENLSQPIVAIFFLTLILSSYVTELIGIHALFGAFMTGAIIPENAKFRNIFIEKVEDVSVVLLLPLFFVFTGLRTQIGLLNEPSLWMTAGVIIAVAVTGKFLGSAIAAKVVGQSWKDSLSIGALMNTRGLMELVVLNIGYDLGVLSPEVFAMMVIMALVTTMMTGPALDMINHFFKDKTTAAPGKIADSGLYKVLISFANPDTGRTLLRLANSFTKNLNGNSELTTMHLSPANDLHLYNIEEYERESFLPVLEESKQLNRKVNTMFKATSDLESDIAEIANKGNYDILLIGVGKSIYQGTLLGNILGFTTRIFHPDKFFDKHTKLDSGLSDSALDLRTNAILTKADVPVGVFIDKDFNTADRIAVAISESQDSFLLEYVQRFISNNQSQVIILELGRTLKNDHGFKERIRQIEQIAPNHIAIVSAGEIQSENFQSTDLFVTSISTWAKLVAEKNKSLADAPSTLILKK
ncbi:cation:proton antiporter [Ohtaekwangia sp.]|uniref:cation:proton antiporter n=1 Tax=Ohtaekwangia sp. TaxID=2066019 RepID=UPI002FDDE2B0